MKHTKITFFTIISIAAALTFTSCGADASFTANTDKSTNIEVNLNFGQAISNTLKALTGSGDFSKMLSEGDLSSAFEKSDLTLAKAKWISQTELTLQGKIAAPEKQTILLTDKGLKIKDFVNCQSNSLELNLSPDTIQGLVSALPEDSQYMLDLFMAPVFTGEAMSADEYLMLLSSVYGKDIGDELKAASINFKMTCPAGKKLLSAQGKSIRKNTNSAQVSLPLVDFLVLSSPLNYKITW